jgi:hypothetical protein
VRSVSATTSPICALMHIRLSTANVAQSLDSGRSDAPRITAGLAAEYRVTQQPLDEVVLERG